VKIERKFKKGQSGLERNWLNARLGEGLYLIGKVENEYIFGRSEEYRTYEYQLRTPAAPKKNPKKAIDPADTLKDIKGLKFITVSSDGSCYYFLKDARIKNRFAEWRGKRISDQLLSASLSVLCLIAFIAFSTLTVYGAVISRTLFTALGGVGLVASLVGFVVFFRKTQKISEARRIYLEEERVRAEAENKAQDPEEKTKTADTTNNNNTVVMNTVVLNKYGDDGKRGRTPVGEIQYDTGFDSVGQLFDRADSPSLDPNVNPAIAASKDPLKLAAALMQNTSPAQGQTVYAEQSAESEKEKEDAIYDGAFSKSSDTGYEENDVSYGDDVPDVDGYDEYEDEDYCESLTPQYVLYGLVTAAGIALAVLSVYLLTLFFTGGNGLFMALAIISLVFSPFLIRYGIANIRYLSEWSCDEDLDEPDEE
jgi:hypothetical protein